MGWRDVFHELERDGLGVHKSPVRTRISRVTVVRTCAILLDFGPSTLWNICQRFTFDRLNREARRKRLRCTWGASITLSVFMEKEVTLHCQSSCGHCDGQFILYEHFFQVWTPMRTNKALLVAAREAAFVASVLTSLRWQAQNWTPTTKQHNDIGPPRSVRFHRDGTKFLVKHVVDVVHAAKTTQFRLAGIIARMPESEIVHRVVKVRHHAWWRAKHAKIDTNRGPRPHACRFNAQHRDSNIVHSSDRAIPVAAVDDILSLIVFVVLRWSFVACVYLHSQNETSQRREDSQTSEKFGSPVGEALFAIPENKSEKSALGTGSMLRVTTVPTLPTVPKEKICMSGGTRCGEHSGLIEGV